SGERPDRGAHLRRRTDHGDNGVPILLVERLEKPVDVVQQRHVYAPPPRHQRDRPALTVTSAAPPWSPAQTPFLHHFLLPPRTRESRRARPSTTRTIRRPFTVLLPAAPSRFPRPCCCQDY